MWQTFDHKGDAMPPGRAKLIHKVGAVGAFAFEATRNHPYTGLFKGSDYGIIRLSSAFEPIPDGNSIAPTIALKFFRDGMPSANLFAQTPTLSQPGNYNYFANTL